MLVRTQAIVLRRIRYSDSSIIATVLTPEYGVESILAKGARTAKSRVAGILQPLEHTELQYYAKPGRQLHLLRSAERTVLRQRLHSSYDHTLAGLAMLETVLRLELPGHPADAVFALLADALAALGAAEANVAAFPVAFAFRFAAAHGFRLSAPRADLLSDSVFAVDTGHLLPASANQTHGVALAAETAQTLLALATVPFSAIPMLELSSEAIVACQELAALFLAFHFERPVRRSQTF